MNTRGGGHLELAETARPPTCSGFHPTLDCPVTNEWTSSRCSWRAPSRQHRYRWWMGPSRRPSHAQPPAPGSRDVLMNVIPRSGIDSEIRRRSGTEQPRWTFTSCGLAAGARWRNTCGGLVARLPTVQRHGDASPPYVGCAESRPTGYTVRHVFCVVPRCLVV